MFLKTDKIVVEIGNLTMRSYKTGVGNEFILDPTAVEGWFDGASVRRDATPRMGQDGDFYEPSKFGARLISFSGTAVASSSGDLRRMRDDLVGVITDGSYQTLSVDTMGKKRTATVSLEGTTSFVRQSDTFATFRIAFYAPDPHIYGDWQTFTTGVGTSNDGGLEYTLSYPLDYHRVGGNTDQTIMNTGNSISWPVFKVTGNFGSGFTIYDNKGSGVEYTGRVSLDAPVTIDMAKGTASQEGIDRTILISRREWFSIAPGETIQPEMIPTSDPTVNGSGWCDILYRDTWI